MELKRTVPLSRTLLALAIGSTFVASAHAEIILSQYVEGGSFNKAIEIANTGDVAVSLDNYILAKSSNGGGSWDTQLPLTGRVIAANDVLVISHESASSAIQTVSDENNGTVVNFNGDDPVALLNTDGSVHDMLGEMGDVDWGKDKTLVRNADSLMPSSTYQTSQWTSLAKDNIDGLGALNAVEPPAAFACTQDGADPVFTTIQEIQGEGATSPFINGYPYITEQDYFVKGVVSAITTGLTKGFYLQALDDDYNANTSEGLFVHTNQSSSDLKPGDVVCVKGKVQEYYNLTQLKAENNQWVKQDQQAAPQATAIEILPSDANFEQTLERYEGMLVKTDRALDMRVTRTFGYDYAGRRNNMVLAQGRINMQPNQLFAAGSEQAKQQSIENAQRRLFVESDQKAADGKIPYYSEFGRSDIDQNGSTEDYIRIDDTIVGLEGVLSYSYNEYRLLVTNQINQDNFVRNDPRTNKPDMDEGDLRIATFNVLNYFNSPFGGDTNLHGDNRGANNLAEFEIQQEKIVNAILRLDADIVGLMEIENNGFGEGAAIRQLVEQLNQRIADKKKRYTFVAVDSNNDGVTDELDSIGTDVITTGVIYREKVVKLQQSRVIPMPSQQAPQVLDDKGKVLEDGKNYQRDTLAPTFKVKGGHEKITVAVNHLKSKGSKCWEDAAPLEQGGQGGNDADFQGACENFRVAAAVALGEALEKINGHKVILGDMNSYGMEDPMLVLTDYSPEKYGKEIKAARNTYIAGAVQFGDDGAVITKSYDYINAVAMKHPDSWSYSFNDEVGALDHLLVSKSLKGKVVDATDWHINGGESTLFDYNDEFKGDLPKYSDHFRASDHDPAVLELNIYGGSLGLGVLMSLLGFGAWRRRK
ncbi:ExeM/NucH family extracellular endonuclease [Vibrio aestuarianus]|uniref:ExeM/NucH family extracellular endonuclease n=1 Tax=Vibrio aestuarianus TaxID=28171 RepID=UPI0014462203|nr:ExeM/NucH family extracellular endonuclease [Vibrio aestuarianus]MDE1212472.1 ExeM/NucH family extracellular endonuclease [Vibrio aestuarianus]MDE1215786.1 ExeM/NucH family extracellular endonuclease [Vibrio aestuarianus]MDE1259598.1 ExeM/NucH family extracellular endonuclease [Vibrio aestuarianus]MDE1266541.1 ExeM/NucH family extracellular endonuclease [Vibrio aestuarianus]MDE1273842.1 ExeM/NucH family extracellular endonuclease [Vibrio aestuarianus]